MAKIPDSGFLGFDSCEVVSGGGGFSPGDYFVGAQFEDLHGATPGDTEGTSFGIMSQRTAFEGKRRGAPLGWPRRGE